MNRRSSEYHLHTEINSDPYLAYDHINHHSHSLNSHHNNNCDSYCDTHESNHYYHIDNPHNDFEGAKVLNECDNAKESNNGVLSLIQQLNKLIQLKKNDECAECRAKNPKWVSILFGISICWPCSEFHALFCLGIAIVKNIESSSWEKCEVDILASMGNKKSNKFWEASLPPTTSHPKPDDSPHVRTSWLIKKYLAHDFLPMGCGKEEINNFIPFNIYASPVISWGSIVREFPWQHLTALSDKSKSLSKPLSPKKKTDNGKKKNLNLITSSTSTSSLRGPEKKPKRRQTFLSNYIDRKSNATNESVELGRLTLTLAHLKNYLHDPCLLKQALLILLNEEELIRMEFTSLMTKNPEK